MLKVPTHQFNVVLEKKAKHSTPLCRTYYITGAFSNLARLYLIRRVI